MKCRQVLDNGETITYSSSYTFHTDRITFSETDEEKKHAFYFLIEKTDDNKARLTVDYYIRKNPLKQFLFPPKKKEDERSAYTIIGPVRDTA